MAKFDPIEERAIEMLDDLRLEAVRAETVVHDDKRFEFVLWTLCLRGVPVIERVCRSRGEARGLSEEEIELATEDAAARMLLRLSHPEPQPQIHALAAEAATALAALAPAPPDQGARRGDRNRPGPAERLGELVSSGKEAFERAF